MCGPLGRSDNDIVYCDIWAGKYREILDIASFPAT